MQQLPAVFSLLDTPAVGGAETYLLSNLRYLAEKGHPIVLATNCAAVKKYLATSSPQKKTQIQVIDLPFRLDAIGNWKGLVKFIVLAPRAVYWLFQVRKTYLHQFQQVTCLLPGFSDRLFFSPWLTAWGYRLLWLEYGPLEPTFHRNLYFPKLLYFLTKHLPEKIITISKTTQRSLITTGRIPKVKTEVIYPGVAIPSIIEAKKRTTEAQSWLNKHKLTGKKLLVAIGRLAVEKEFALLIEGYKTAIDQLSEASLLHLVIIGDGSELQNIKTQIKRLNLTRRVVLTGFIPDTEKQALFAAADIFVFPSAWPLEGFGITTIEAMTWAVPVITTGAGPQAEIIRDGVDGLYFQAKDSQSLAKQIIRLIQDPNLSQKLGHSGKVRATQLFNETKMHNQLARLI